MASDMTFNGTSPVTDTMTLLFNLGSQLVWGSASANEADGLPGAARQLGSGASKTILDGEPFPAAFALFMGQVFVILALSKIMSKMLGLIKQPAVVGEMLAGILLGPTALGRIPNFSTTLFPAPSLIIIKTIADFALIFFMFIVGLELDPAKLRADARMSLAISAVGIVVPAGASALLALLFYNETYVIHTSFVNLVLFLTVTLGMSALPVLARILSERRMLATRLGALAMTVAAVDDIIGWCLLAITIALIRSTSQLGVLYTILVTIGELLFMYFVVGPLIRWIARRSDRSGSNHQVSADTFLVLCLILIGSSWLAEVIGLSSLIGAFQVGLLIPRTSSLAHSLSEKFEYFTVAILMPLFFTSSGLRTQFGLIDNGLTFGMALLVIAVATGSKIVGISLPCMYYGIPTRLSMIIGVLMSCKGLVALIVVNIAYDSGVITPKFFAILVLMVLVTTLSTVPLMDAVDPPSNTERRLRDTAAFESMIGAKDAKTAAAARAEVQAGTGGSGPSDEDSTRGGDGAGDGSSGTMVISPSTDSLLGASASVTGGAPESSPSGSDTEGESFRVGRDPTDAAVASPSSESAPGTGATSGAGSGVLDVLRSVTRTMSMRLRSRTASLALTGPSPAMGPQGSGSARPSSAGSPSGVLGGSGAASQDIEAGGASLDGLELPPSAAALSALTPAAPMTAIRRRKRAPSTAAPRVVHVGLAVSDTSYAPSLVSVANMFSPTPDPLLPGAPSAKLTLLWMLENLDMPSAYMKWIQSIEEIRDATLASSLARARLRDSEAGVGVSALPSSHVIPDTFDEAGRKGIDVALLPSGFFKPPIGSRAAAGALVSPSPAPAHDTEGDLEAGVTPAPAVDDEVMATVLKALRSTPRPCISAVLFENDAGILFSAARVLMPVPAGSRMAEPALSFLKRTATDVEVTLLRSGAAPPSSQAPQSPAIAGATRVGRTWSATSDSGLAVPRTVVRLSRGASVTSRANTAVSEDDVSVIERCVSGGGLSSEDEDDGYTTDDGTAATGGISRSASEARRRSVRVGRASSVSSADDGPGEASGGAEGLPAATTPVAPSRPLSISGSMFTPLPTLTEVAYEQTLNSVTGPALGSELRRVALSQMDTVPEAAEGAEALAAGGATGEGAPATGPTATAPGTPPMSPIAPTPSPSYELPVVPSFLRRRPNVREVFPSHPECVPALGRLLDGSGHGAYSLLVLGAQPDVPPGSDPATIAAAQVATARRVAEVMAVAAKHRLAVLVCLPREK